MRSETPALRLAVASFASRVASGAPSPFGKREVGRAIGRSSRGVAATKTQHRTALGPGQIGPNRQLFEQSDEPGNLRFSHPSTPLGHKQHVCDLQLPREGTTTIDSPSESTPTSVIKCSAPSSDESSHSR